MKKFFKITLITIILIFALIGMFFTAVYFSMQKGLLNVRGTIEERNSYYGVVASVPFYSATSTAKAEVTNGCLEHLDQAKPCEWNETVEWQVVRGGLEKDIDIINQVAKETGVSSRMIVATVLPEQIRFFTDNREVFKRYFEPLKILASLSQFSLGVSGIKQKTAEEIELHANDTFSPFYPGDNISQLLTYSSSTKNKSDELFNRLTDEKNHYYSYLYTAIYIKEIEQQWRRAGFDVSRRPDVLVTLFNLGFNSSVPKAKPRVGGAPITTGGQRYSYGDLGATFYHSEEMLDIFPK